MMDSVRGVRAPVSVLRVGLLEKSAARNKLNFKHRIKLGT